MVICPGGAYGMTSDREAEAIAVRFMGMGYHTVVLRYSVAPARYPVALRQLAKTVALLRENSDKWHIEKNKIIVSGFSAGGHLAASLGVFWNTEELAGITGMENERIRPNGMILNYPVITSGEVGHEESFRNLLGDRYEEPVSYTHLPMEELIVTSYPYVYGTEQIDDCMERLKDYSEDSIPVLDDDNRFLGVITSAGIIDLVDDEMGEDYAKLAGLTAEEDLKEPLFESMKKRMPWLIVLLGLGMVVSSVVDVYKRQVLQWQI